MSLENLYKKQIPMNARVVSGHGVAGKIDPTRAPIIGTGIGVGRGDSLKGAGGSNEPIKPDASQQPGVGEFLGSGIGVGR